MSVLPLRVLPTPVFALVAFTCVCFALVLQLPRVTSWLRHRWGCGFFSVFPLFCQHGFPVYCPIFLYTYIYIYNSFFDLCRILSSITCTSPTNTLARCVWVAFFRKPPGRWRNGRVSDCVSHLIKRRLADQAAALYVHAAPTRLIRARSGLSSGRRTPTPLNVTALGLRRSQSTTNPFVCGNQDVWWLKLSLHSLCRRLWLN